MKSNNSIIRDADYSSLPERVGIDDLSIAGDILIYEGLKKLKDIIDDPVDQDTVIRAFNATVGMQKYIVQRKRSESDIKAPLEDDLEI